MLVVTLAISARHAAVSSPPFAASSRVNNICEVIEAFSEKQNYLSVQLLIPIIGMAL
jgi:hypothetical protein